MSFPSGNNYVKQVVDFITPNGTWIDFVSNKVLDVTPGIKSHDKAKSIAKGVSGAALAAFGGFSAYQAIFYGREHLNRVAGVAVSVATSTYQFVTPKVTSAVQVALPYAVSVGSRIANVGLPAIQSAARGATGLTQNIARVGAAYAIPVGVGAVAAYIGVQLILQAYEAWPQTTQEGYDSSCDE